MFVSASYSRDFASRCVPLGSACRRENVLSEARANIVAVGAPRRGAGSGLATFPPLSSLLYNELSIAQVS
jgi:hypothetical protein